MRRLIVPLVFAALAAAPAASADGSRLAAALVRTAQVESLRFSLTGSIAVSGETVPLEAHGAVDNRTRSSRVVLDLSKLPLPGVRSIGGARVEELVDGRALVLYLKFPLLQKLLPSGKPWLKLDLRQAAGSQGLDLGSLLQTSPTQQLQLACALAGPARALGSAPVRGVQTTHYHTVLDYSQAVRCAPASQRPSLRKLAPQIAGGGAVPLDVYVDGGGLVRRLSYSYAIRASGGSVRTALAMDLYDFGANLDVALPPPSQVQDLTKLIGKPRQGGG